VFSPLNCSRCWNSCVPGELSAASSNQGVISRAALLWARFPLRFHQPFSNNRWRRDRRTFHLRTSSEICTDVGRFRNCIARAWASSVWEVRVPGALAPVVVLDYRWGRPQEARRCQGQ
jgi:hypothetical protein